MRRSSLAALAPFAVAVASLCASPLGCAEGVGSAADGSAGVGGQGGPSTTTSVAESASAATGGGVCDDSGACETCRSCAINGECSPQYDACTNDLDCLDYDECIGACPDSDSACLDDCGTLHPSGEQTFFEYAFCLICGACFGDCKGTTAICTP